MVCRNAVICCDHHCHSEHDVDTNKTIIADVKSGLEYFMLVIKIK
jgi:hypothetical protein